MEDGNFIFIMIKKILFWFAKVMSDYKLTKLTQNKPEFEDNVKYHYTLSFDRIGP